MPANQQVQRTWDDDNEAQRIRQGQEIRVFGWWCPCYTATCDPWILGALHSFFRLGQASFFRRGVTRRLTGELSLRHTDRVESRGDQVFPPNCRALHKSENGTAPIRIPGALDPVSWRRFVATVGVSSLIFVPRYPPIAYRGTLIDMDRRTAPCDNMKGRISGISLLFCGHRSWLMSSPAKSDDGI